MKEKHDKFIKNCRMMLSILLLYIFIWFIYFTIELNHTIIEETYEVNYDVQTNTTDFILNLKLHKHKYWRINISFYDEDNMHIETRTHEFYGKDVELIFDDIDGSVSTYYISNLNVEFEYMMFMILLITLVILSMFTLLSFGVRTKTLEIDGRIYLVYAGFINHYLYENDILVDSQNGFTMSLYIYLECLNRDIKVIATINAFNIIEFKVVSLKPEDMF